MSPDLVAQIDDLLPQTQCTKCGYAGCRPYAEALGRGEADINRCPPGGVEGVRALAQLLGRDFKALDPTCGIEKPQAAALIDERWCIGCTLCIEACPVDAIVGASKRMHTVLLDRCTGCELCVAPCPVDCIDMIDLEQLRRRGVPILQTGPEASVSRARYRHRQMRIAAQRDQRLADQAKEKLERLKQEALLPDIAHKRAAVRAALGRARARRARVR